MTRISTANYDSPSGFIFPANLIEINNGARLLDQRPDNAIYYHNFKQNDAAWANGPLGFTLSGSATINNDILTLANSGVGYGYTNSITDHGSKGCIKFWFKAGHTGSPSATIQLMRSANSFGGNNNLIQLVQDTAGAIRLTLKNENGSVVITNAPFGTYAFDNNWHEFSLNYDTIIGFWKLFIDGVAQGGEYSFSYTRTGGNIVTLGSTTSAPPEDNEYNGLLIYDTVQETSDYIPFPIISDTIYSTSIPLIESNIGIVTDQIISFSALAVNVVYMANIAGINLWHNGISWVESTSPNESNNYDDYRNNIASIDLGEGAILKTIVGLKSDGSDQSTIDSKTTIYEFDFISPNIPTCIVYGRIADACDKPVEGAVIEVSGEDFFHSNTLVAPACSTVSDANGEFEINLVETETVGKVVDIAIMYKDGKKNKTTKIEGVFIPNKEIEKIEDLTTP
jgi:hypothetical protein